MKKSELIKRIIDTANYNEMCIDYDMSIEYACEIADVLTTKDLKQIVDTLVTPLMDQYRDSECKDEQKYITATVQMIFEYLRK